MSEEYSDGFVPGKEHFLYMNGREVYKFATRVLVDSVQKAAGKAGIEISQLDHLITHQANVRIVNTAIEKLGIDPQKVYVNLDKYGNTSSASIPICLDEMKKDGRFHAGDWVAMVGFGGGLTYGAVIFRW